jgi:hypothetical protein
MYVNMKEVDIGGRGGGPGKSDRVATMEVLKQKGIMVMSPQEEDVINKLELKVRFRVF